jgi:hypothetical protein
MADVQQFGRTRLEPDARKARTLIPQLITLQAPLTSTSWDGDSFSTTAKTKIDLSSVFSAPEGIRAITAGVRLRDSGSAGNDCWLILSPNSTVGNGISFGCSGLANNRRSRESAIIPCDAAGDIYYQINASGAGTMDIWIEIWGYWI